MVYGGFIFNYQIPYHAYNIRKDNFTSVVVLRGLDKYKKNYKDIYDGIKIFPGIYKSLKTICRNDKTLNRRDVVVHLYMLYRVVEIIMVDNVCYEYGGDFIKRDVFYPVKGLDYNDMGENEMYGLSKLLFTTN